MPSTVCSLHYPTANLHHNLEISCTYTTCLHSPATSAQQTHNTPHPHALFPHIHPYHHPHPLASLLTFFLLNFVLLTHSHTFNIQTVTSSRTSRCETQQVTPVLFIASEADHNTPILGTRMPHKHLYSSSLSTLPITPTTPPTTCPTNTPLPPPPPPPPQSPTDPPSQTDCVETNPNEHFSTFPDRLRKNLPRQTA